ncbi:nicotinate (nicotinamide) nucleotide adenylyltransferase [Parvicella tangerina]|uniref:Probable nicotinate-nucleotide adenylyltransferase n=1 Tax=Parvicella tangerina TaxID=2829795 RepID=A0A916NR12_9FLAO|nr:nicotinate (nicotinamide) nucleotide adenylyltransferase [Parvicella tangerina]CAG5080249.1 Nicotinate-nucleotide adenylyltransferase [Parvicella tangerina]
MSDTKIDLDQLLWGENPTGAKKIGLFFGTFNPIHVGHLILANYIVSATSLDEVWFVVTPHNPHKKKASLLDDHHRLAMVKEAIEDNIHLRASDVEFGLPQPNYTTNTLAHLREKYPEKAFVLIMGEDNLRSFHKWKNYEEILKHHKIVVYPRVHVASEDSTSEVVASLDAHEQIIKCDAPIMNISATFIRDAIKNGQDVRYMLTDPVFKYVDEMNFYR